MGPSELVIRVLCLASVLLYAASATLIGAPNISFPDATINKVIVVSNDKASRQQADSVTEEFVYSLLSRKINSLEPIFGKIGRFTQPITIEIDSDHPTRVSVGAVDIILGVKAIEADGQVEHAVLKSWLLQKGNSSIIVNPLKLETAADFLMSLYRGQLRISDPVTGKRAQYSQMKNWSEDLLSTGDLCSSPWRAAELIPFCNHVDEKSADVISFLGLRKVVGELLFSQVSKERLKNENILKITSQNLQSQAELENKSAEFDQVTSLEALRKLILATAEQIFPRANLQLKEPSIEIAKIKNGKRELLSGFNLSAREFSQAKTVIVETCSATSANEILRVTPENSEHILLVRDCGNVKKDYQAFLVGGVPRFALRNPSVKFAYLHRDSLKLADKLLNNFDVLAALDNETTFRGTKFLGLDQKILREDLNAYKVNGPIGAVEWFRIRSTKEAT